MESSRIFIRGLPPSITEPDFRKHFGAKHTVTDARLFPQRRIGYIGYQTPGDAEKAVKYFNKTFIRMSKIAVELARPIEDEAPRKMHTQSEQPGRVEPRSGAEPNSLKRKRPSPEPPAQDSKLDEFLEAMKPPSKSKVINSHEQTVAQPDIYMDGQVPTDGESDQEYQTVAKKRKAPAENNALKVQPVVPALSEQKEMTGDRNTREENEMVAVEKNSEQDNTANLSDDAWLRSRTSRLLGLVEDEDVKDSAVSRVDTDAVDSNTIVGRELEESIHGREENTAAALIQQDQSTHMDPTPTPTSDNEAEQKIIASQRLYVRNLAYTITEDDMRTHFATFGELLEVHVPLDNKTGTPKGFAYVQFVDSDSAVKAWQNLDRTVFQGRLLHIIPAAEKRTTQLDDYAISKLPLKQQQRIKRKREASSSTFNWNALYMNADAVMSSVADRLGVAKSELLDPTSSDAAVKQAHAETHVIQETKAYFKQHGVDLDAFKKRERGDTTILVKNFPYDTKEIELRRLLEEHGTIKTLLIPPTGTIAIVEFEQAPQARAAFSALAYKKVSGSVLFLEKAPKDLLLGTSIPRNGDEGDDSRAKPPTDSASDLLQPSTNDTTAATSTLFVRNLNFSTTSERLTQTFQPLDGFISARVKTKTDAKKPGQVLSMGFGFLEFRSKSQAQAAQTAMDGYNLEGHKLQVRASHKAADAAEERRNEDKAKKLAGRRTKIVIKNLPFETSKKDIRALFGSYGQLRSVRMPKKFDKAARGFAFADFTTPKEAENAMDALRDTHLLGRRLVLDFAAEDPEDAEAEIEKMQKKVGSQINKVALQKLTGNGRRKFNVGDQDAEEA